MDARNLARLLGVGRLAIGGALIAAPGQATSGWVGRAGAEPGGRVLARGLGIRDAVIGAATLATAEDPIKRAPVLAAGIACDLVDLAATVGTEELSPAQRAGTALIAGGAAIAGAIAATG